MSVKHGTVYIWGFASELFPDRILFRIISEAHYSPTLCTVKWELMRPCPPKGNRRKGKKKLKIKPIIVAPLFVAVPFSGYGH